MDLDEIWTQAVVFVERSTALLVVFSFIIGIGGLALYGLTGSPETLPLGVFFVAGGVIMIYHWYREEGS